MPSHRIAAKAMIASCLLLGSLSPGTAPAAPLNRLVSFSKKLCDSNAPGARCDATQPALPTTFTVVSRIGHRKVNQLVIEFVSGVCVGDGRADYIAITSTPDGAPKKNPDAGDNFSNNYFYFTPNQYIAPAGRCCVPRDYIPLRSYALFEARSILREVFGCDVQGKTA